MSPHTTIVEIETAPFENIAQFGMELAWFERRHPRVKFDWVEAEYAEEDDEDEDGNSLIDNETVFPNDINYAVFLVHFRTKRGLELYKAFQRRIYAASPDM